MDRHCRGGAAHARALRDCQLARTLLTHRSHSQLHNSSSVPAAAPAAALVADQAAPAEPHRMAGPDATAEETTASPRRSPRKRAENDHTESIEKRACPAPADDQH
jgi:hypothetical protein